MDQANGQQRVQELIRERLEELSDGDREQLLSEARALPPEERAHFIASWLNTTSTSPVIQDHFVADSVSQGKSLTPPATRDEAAEMRSTLQAQSLEIGDEQVEASRRALSQPALLTTPQGHPPLYHPPHQVDPEREYEVEREEIYEAEYKVEREVERDVERETPLDWSIPQDSSAAPQAQPQLLPRQGLNLTDDEVRHVITELDALYHELDTRVSRGEIIPHFNERIADRDLANLALAAQESVDQDLDIYEVSNPTLELPSIDYDSIAESSYDLITRNDHDERGDARELGEGPSDLDEGDSAVHYTPLDDSDDLAFTPPELHELVFGDSTAARIEDHVDQRFSELWRVAEATIDRLGFDDEFALDVELEDDVESHRQRHREGSGGSDDGSERGDDTPTDHPLEIVNVDRDVDTNERADERADADISADDDAGHVSAEGGIDHHDEVTPPDTKESSSNEDDPLNTALHTADSPPPLHETSHDHEDPKDIDEVRETKDTQEVREAPAPSSQAPRPATAPPLPWLSLNPDKGVSLERYELNLDQPKGWTDVIEMYQIWRQTHAPDEVFYLSGLLWDESSAEVLHQYHFEHPVHIIDSSLYAFSWVEVDTPQLTLERCELDSFRLLCCSLSLELNSCIIRNDASLSDDDPRVRVIPTIDDEVTELLWSVDGMWTEERTQPELERYIRSVTVHDSVITALNLDLDLLPELTLNQARVRFTRDAATPLTAPTSSPVTSLERLSIADSICSGRLDACHLSVGHIKRSWLEEITLNLHLSDVDPQGCLSFTSAYLSDAQLSIHGERAGLLMRDCLIESTRFVGIGDRLGTLKLVGCSLASHDDLTLTDLKLDTISIELRSAYSELTDQSGLASEPTPVDQRSSLKLESQRHFMRTGAPLHLARHPSEVEVLQSLVVFDGVSADHVSALHVDCATLIFERSSLNGVTRHMMSDDAERDQVGLILSGPRALDVKLSELHKVTVIGDESRPMRHIRVHESALNHVVFKRIEALKLSIEESSLKRCVLLECAVDRAVSLTSLDPASEFTFLRYRGALHLSNDVGEELIIQRSKLTELKLNTVELGALTLDEVSVARFDVTPRGRIELIRSTRCEWIGDTQSKGEMTPSVSSSRLVVGQLTLDRCEVRGSLLGLISVLDEGRISSCALGELALARAHFANLLRISHSEIIGNGVMRSLICEGRCVIASLRVESGVRLIDQARFEGDLVLTDLSARSTLDLSGAQLFSDVWLERWYCDVTIPEVSRATHVESEQGDEQVGVQSVDLSKDQRSGLATEPLTRPLTLLNLSRVRCLKSLYLSPPQLIDSDSGSLTRRAERGGVRLHIALDGASVSGELDLSQMKCQTKSEVGELLISERSRHRLVAVAPFLGSISISAAHLNMSALRMPRYTLSALGMTAHTSSASLSYQSLESIYAEERAVTGTSATHELSSSHGPLTHEDQARHELELYDWLTLLAHEAHEATSTLERNALEVRALRALLRADRLVRPWRSLMSSPWRWLRLNTRTHTGERAALTLLVKLMVITAMSYLSVRLVAPTLAIEQSVLLVTRDAWLEWVNQLLGADLGVSSPNVAAIREVTWVIATQRLLGLWVLVRSGKSRRAQIARLARSLKRRLAE